MFRSLKSAGALEDLPLPVFVELAAVVAKRVDPAALALVGRVHDGGLSLKRALERVGALHRLEPQGIVEGLDDDAALLLGDLDPGRSEARLAHDPDFGEDEGLPCDSDH